MNKDDVIELACEIFGGLIKQDERQNFIKFANLVAKHEREACENVCDAIVHHPMFSNNESAKMCLMAIKARGQA